MTGAVAAALNAQLLSLAVHAASVFVFDAICRANKVGARTVAVEVVARTLSSACDADSRGESASAVGISFSVFSANWLKDLHAQAPFWTRTFLFAYDCRSLFDSNAGAVVGDSIVSTNWTACIAALALSSGFSGNGKGDSIAENETKKYKVLHRLARLARV